MKSSHGHRERLKRKWLQSGPKGFHDYEFLELLLTFAIPRKDTKPIAKQLLETYGSIKNILNTNPKSLQNTPGLGEHSSILINLLAHCPIYTSKPTIGQKVNSPNELSQFFISHIGSKKEEFFYIILLDQKNCILDWVEIEHGIENRAQIYIKRIVRHCLDHHATALICAHNHPSDTAEFSQADILLTKELFKTLKSLDIRLLDHLLVTNHDYLSMVEQEIDFSS